MYRSGYGGWRPYVSVSERRARSKRLEARLRKKGIRLAPVVPEGREIARSFWGRAWCENLEGYADYANRLPRGRRYARNGSVIHLDVAEGCVSALVSGSDVYEVEVKVRSTAAKTWSALRKECVGRIDSLVDLLRGRLSDAVMARISRPKDGLFPAPREMRFTCSCPDWADMCKHVAAVLYGVGNRLDAAPELLFLLRGVDHGELIAGALDAGVPGGAGRAPANALESDAALDALFGIEIAPEAPPGKTRRRAAGTARTTRAAKGARRRAPAAESAEKTRPKPGARRAPKQGTASAPEAKARRSREAEVGGARAKTRPAREKTTPTRKGKRGAARKATTTRTDAARPRRKK